MQATNALSVARGIVANMSDPALLLDTELSPIAYSGSYSDLTGFRRRQFVRVLQDGMSPFEMLGGNQEDAKTLARRCMQTKTAIHLAEEPIKNQRGDAFTVLLSYLPVVSVSGEAAGVILVFRDVSAEARLQSRYRNLLDQERSRAQSLKREVEKRTRELSSALIEVTRLSRVDPLTELLNRRAFTELANQAIKLATRHSRSMGLLLGDLDHFKKINDTFGHMIGDAILASSALAMRKAVRDSDPVARFGGEEFVILLTETDRESVSIVGERVRTYVADIRNKGKEGERWPTPTMSLGMAVFPDHGTTLDELISNADKALYRAKNTGRDRAIMFSEGSFNEEAPRTQEDIREILIVGTSQNERYNACLPEFCITFVENELEALSHCKNSRFEAFIADFESPEDSIEFLRKAQRFNPESLRVLVISSKELFVELRGAGMARIDSYLLRHEAPEHLEFAINDGLIRREQDRNRIMLKTDSVKRLFSSRIDELESLIQNRELEFVYQPIVDPKTQKLFAYEALCRAKHAIFRNPQVLFDAALQAGLLWELGRAVRETSIQVLEKIPDHIKLFMNLHPGEVDDPELATFGSSALATRVVFEITERASIPDYERFKKRMAVLSQRGYQFAIDDLGAGYAGLNAVALLAPEFIKIDMAMVRGIHLQPQRAKLIKRIVDFANDVDIKLIAEGIETAKEAKVICDLGCHLVQGYYYSRPKTI